MQDFHNLSVWMKAHQLTLAVFQVSDHLAKQEHFGFTAQIRRSATNIPTRIAEGCSRPNNTEFTRCLQQSVASSSELEYLILLARDLNYITPETHDALLAQLIEVRKMLSGLLRTL